MSRCLTSEILFHDDNDRAAFVDILAKTVLRTEYRCYAWVLMPNHYHLIMRSSDQDLWRFMKPLNAAYAQLHKKRHLRDGPLFRDRYKSIVTQDQNYIGELVRYVHLNPVRAGICRNLDELAQYPWSGHAALMGNRSCRFMDVSAVLRGFGTSVSAGRRAYRQFLEEGIEKGDAENDLLSLVRASNAGVEAGRKPSCWVIGDHDFVKTVIDRAEGRRLRISRFEQEGGRLDQIATKVAKHFSVDVARLRRRCRGGKESEARKVFAYVALHEYHAPSSAIADFCGTGIAAVSALAKAGHQVVSDKKMDILIF